MNSSTDLKETMLDRLGNSDAFFRSQQKGESDLTFNEKREIAEEILNRDISLFLQRFYKFLTLEDTKYFEPNRNLYEVSFYIEEVRKLNDFKKNSIVIKNRRYEAMQRLVLSGEYFSDPEMRHRNPYLYDQMIGQYLTDQERETLEEPPDSATFSCFLMRSIQKGQEERLRKEQEAYEKAIGDDDTCEEENEEESELESEEDDDYGGICRSRAKKCAISDEEKDILRREFTNIMYESFLSGKDEYDYRNIDENSEFDNVQQYQTDEEEKYFDDDE